MTRLLTIGIRVRTVLESVIRERLAQEQDTLVGLYAGQPSRTTARPTAERVLAAFRSVTLTVIHQSGRVSRQFTPLSALHQRLLGLAGLDSTVSTRLLGHAFKPPGEISEQ